MTQLTLKATGPLPLVLRDMLEEMAVKELQGPAQGDEEEVPNASGTATSSASSPPDSGLRTCPCPCSRSPPPRPPRTTMCSKATSHPVRNLGLRGLVGVT